MGGGGGVRGGRIENIYTLDYSPLALTGSFHMGLPHFFQSRHRLAIPV